MKWIIGNPKKFHNLHYTPIETPVLGTIMTDVCWVLGGGEHTNLIAQAPEMREVLEHAVNWGHGFEGVGLRPPWLTEAEELLHKVTEEIDDYEDGLDQQETMSEVRNSRMRRKG